MKSEKVRIYKNSNTQIIEVSEQINLLGNAFNYYLDNVTVSQKTKESYKSSFKAFTIWLNTKGKFVLNRMLLIEYRSFLLSEVDQKRIKLLYASNLLSQIKPFFSFLSSDDTFKDFNSDIAKGLTISSDYDGYKKEPLTSDEVQRLIKYVTIDTNNESELRTSIMILIMLETGARGIELHRADINDIETKFDKSVLMVRQKGKAEKSHAKVLSESVKLLIDKYLKVRFDIRSISALTTKQKSEALFVGTSNRSKGKRISTVTIRKTIKAALLAVDIDSEKKTTHSLRHTLGSAIFERENDINKVAEILGHSNTKHTMKYVKAAADKARIKSAISFQELYK